MSCRYQPDYRGDAMFRGDAMGRTEPCLDFTFDILDGFYVPSPVTGRLIPHDSILPLDCDETIENVEISDMSRHSLYRTSDPVTNRSYLARLFTFHADDPDKYRIELNNVVGFTPYIVVKRSATKQWQGYGNQLTFVVEPEDTGPMTLEITTLDRRETGSFDVTLNCSVASPYAAFKILYHIPAPSCIGSFEDPACYDEFNNTSIHIRVVNLGFGFTSLRWDFGNGHVVEDFLLAVNYTYPVPGNYTITYTVTDGIDTSQAQQDVAAFIDV